MVKSLSVFTVLGVLKFRNFRELVINYLLYKDNRLLSPIVSFVIVNDGF